MNYLVHKLSNLLHKHINSVQLLWYIRKKDVQLSKPDILYYNRYSSRKTVMREAEQRQSCRSS